MIRRIPALGGICVGIGLMLSPAVAQQPPASRTYTPPKTPWGEPDLQGIWPLNHLIATPFQRPEKYGDRGFLTDDEFAAAQKSAEARNKRFESGAIPQADSGTQVMRQTSLLVDPPNGRFPALTPNGKALYDKMHGSYKPGQTVFDIKEWLGESRGRWEGNTLVVEMTNFNGKTDMTNAGVPGSPPLNPASENMRIAERFTRTADDTIDYEMHVEDPEIVSRPWAVAFPLKLDNKYQMYEYACHEGNTAIRGYIETSRFERAHPKTPK
jgi:hypothetical protein